MKKFLGLATGLLLSVFTMAQQGVTFDDASADYNKATVNSFNFTMSDAYSLEEINKSAAYYVDYFSVSTSAIQEGGNNVIFTLNDETDLARRVITRFFITLEVNEIDVNGTQVELNEFIEEYIAE